MANIVIWLIPHIPHQGNKYIMAQHTSTYRLQGFANCSVLRIAFWIGFAYNHHHHNFFPFCRAPCFELQNVLHCGRRMADDWMDGSWVLHIGWWLIAAGIDDLALFSHSVTHSLHLFVISCGWMVRGKCIGTEYLTMDSNEWYCTVPHNILTSPGLQD